MHITQNWTAMNSSGRLVQNKRKRMLCLVLLLVLVPFIDVGATINLTYILKKDGSEIQPSCIAEETERYAAVGWVYPMPTDERGIPNITTKFIPTIKNDYNCKFSKNDLCSAKWSLKDWYIEESSEFLGDVRWEDLPTVFISNATNEVKERTEVPKAFKSGISVRAGGIIELFVCNGWNPHSYPCYHFHINSTEIYLNKYAMLPKDLNDDFKKSYLKYYKAFSSILSHDEWRNFVVSFDKNTLKLFDVNLNRIVIEHTDDEPLTPAYLLMRSSNTSLWKVHKNEFLYTNTTQTSRLGPQVTITNKDLCVSLFVTTCSNCQMDFFYLNGGKRKVLKHVGSSQNGEWMEIKLKEENIPVDKLYLFVETKFQDEWLNDSSGFWAVDNVRICNENEVKVSFLKLNSTVRENEASEEYISCQLIKKPSWRPKQLTYDKISVFPHIEASKNTTSIKLSWAQEDSMNQISYFVSYQGNDICTAAPHNLKRVKSDGFLTTRLNEVVLDNLVPYTIYNITISTVLHEEDQLVYVNTLETVEPTFGELPYKVKVQPTENAVYVSWNEVKCTDRYGHIIYTLVVTNKNMNFAKRLEFQAESSYKIEGLEPYTPYSLNITTARTAANINNGIYSSSIAVNFTTLAGVSPPVENLELYSIDENSASLRYDLPKDPRGVPADVQVVRCNALSFKKCKSYESRIKRCPLWPQKFCVVLNNLLEHQSFYFRLSLKNLGTQVFGKEVSVQGYMMERVPGPPTNISYKVVDCHVSTDYCHLNVSWSHPYLENGTITSFNIILNSTNKRKNSEEDKFIHEVYKVENKSYSPVYTYQIQYIPYSTSYILNLYSANTMYKSNSTSTVVKTDNIGQHIDQSPKLLGNSDSTLVFEIPRLDSRLQSYTLTVVVQDFDTRRDVDPEVMKNKKVAEYLCHRFGETWISQKLKVQNNDTEKIMIGNSEKDRIKPKTKYCITFIITNRYKDSEHDVVYYEKLETPDAAAPPKKAGNSSQYNHLYVLLLLLLLVPAGFLIYRYLRKKRVIGKPAENNDNVYESMPFDDCDTNCVSNDNYDKLLHK